jgi:hypothetical protein
MAKCLAKALEEDQVFRRIILADCLLGDDGCIQICNALKQNTSIEHLDLKGNNIRSDGTISISQLLKVNSSIRWLSVEWNCLGIWEVGVRAFADSMALNQGLQELDLRNNKIGPDAASLLARCLKSNTTLQRLDLRWNNLGIVGGRALLEMLKWNQRLLYVEVQGNEVPDDIARAIDMAVERNRNLHRSEFESSKRASFLSDTLQQLSVEHEESLQGLKARLLQAETEAQSLGRQLTVAAEEIDASHLGSKVVEQKLIEERARRERAEQKLQEFESVLVRERKEFAEKCQEFMNDVIREREERRLLEESYRQKLIKESENSLTADSRLRECELKMERAVRDVKESEMELLKAREYHKKQLLDTESQWKQKNSQLLDQLRATMEQVEKSKSAYGEMEMALKSMDVRIRQDEQVKRQEIINRLQATSQQRDSMQAALQQHKSIINDLEGKLSQSSDQIKLFQQQLTQAASDRDELQKVKSLQSQMQKRNDDLSAALSKLESENGQLKDDLRHLRDKLDRKREDEVSRARELERAVSSYVKSIERGSGSR